MRSRALCGRMPFDLSKRARMQRSWRAVLVAVVSALVVGCSGSSAGLRVIKPSASAPPVGGAGFATSAAHVCHAVQERARSKGPFPYLNFNASVPSPASLLPAVGAFYAETSLPAFRGGLRRLRALGRPASGRSTWSTFITDWTAWTDNLRRQVRAAKSRDDKGFVRTVNWFSDQGDVVASAAAATKVSSCALLFVSE